MAKRKKILEPGMEFIHPDSGRTMVVQEITRDAIYVEVEREVCDRDGNWKTEVRKREVPKAMWQAFRSPYQLVT
jgi:hypothetical protein